MGEQQPVLEHEPHPSSLGRKPRRVGSGQPDLAGHRGAHAGDGLEHQALAGAARAEQHHVAAVGHVEVDRPGPEPAGLHLESAQLDHGAPFFERRRGTRNDRTSRNTTKATMTMSTAGGCAALSPNPSKRSNVSTEMTLGL